MTLYREVADPKLAKALAHPLRARVLTALDGRTASPSELADELGMPVGVVSYHVRRLTALGFVKLVKRVPRRGAVEHYYTALPRLRMTGEEWAAAPRVVRRAATQATLEQIALTVTASAADGGFDAPDAHLSRSPVTVDEEGLRALSAELQRVGERIEEIERESRGRLSADHGASRRANVVLMLFESAAATQEAAAMSAEPPTPLPGARRRAPRQRIARA